jgi:hypothetical protein
MSDSNDQALIKVAIELRQIENAIQVAGLVKNIQARIKSCVDHIRNGHGNTPADNRDPKKALTDIVLSDNCAVPMKHYVGFLRGLQTDFAEVDEFLEKSKARQLELQKLVDLYTAGQDIVAAKLKGLDE